MEIDKILAVSILVNRGNAFTMNALYSMAVSNLDKWGLHIKERMAIDYDWKEEDRVFIEFAIQEDLSEDFQTYFYKSAFLIIYAESESAINKYIECLSGILYKETHIKSYRSVWQRFQTILESSGLSELKQLSSNINWSDFNAYRLIRNSIAHTNHISTKNEAIMNYIMLNKDKIELNHTAQIKSAFIEKFMEDIANIDELLLQHLRNEYFKKTGFSLREI